jgi:hypothetical protein
MALRKWWLRRLGEFLSAAESFVHSDLRPVLLTSCIVMDSADGGLKGVYSVSVRASTLLTVRWGISEAILRGWRRRQLV